MRFNAPRIGWSGDNDPSFQELIWQHIRHSARKKRGIVPLGKAKGSALADAPWCMESRIERIQLIGAPQLTKPRNWAVIWFCDGKW